MERAIYLLLICSLLNCNSKKSHDSKEGKSRSERVSELSYRKLQLDSVNEHIIRGDISELLNRINSLDSVRLFFISRNGDFGSINNSRWTTGQDAIDAANELWRTMDITSTLVVYPSFSQNATTGETSEIFVVEVENDKLTGTCRMFFNNSRPSELTPLSYTERN